MIVLIIILFVIIVIQGIMIGTLKSRCDELHNQYINLDGWVNFLRSMEKANSNERHKQNELIADWQEYMRKHFGGID